MTRSKLRLMPYLFAQVSFVVRMDGRKLTSRQAIKTHETGTPMMRPMILEFPNDPTCAYLDRQ